MTHTEILSLVSNAIIVRGVASGNLYLISKFGNRLSAQFIDGKWKLSTGEFKTNYFKGSPDFEIIAESI